MYASGNTPRVTTSPPDGLTLKHDRDLVGRERRPHVRWIIVGVLSAFVLLGLLNVFGQRPATSIATTPAARLKLYAPESSRDGRLGL